MSVYRIAIVDDDAIMRKLLSGVLRAYEPDTFFSAEECLAAVSSGLPVDLFLLDVTLPGLDGFDLCRALKQLPAHKNTPVIFVSGHDSLASVMQGYEAGGEDFIHKPIQSEVLYKKIETIQRISLERSELLKQIDGSGALTELVLSNLDEYAALIKFLRTLNTVATYSEVVEALLYCLSSFGLEGAVQLRVDGNETTHTRAGEDWPMEASVIQHVRTLGTIFEFKNRVAYNQEHLTILITNMPTDAPERCGRLRDHMAIVTESSNAKLAAISESLAKAGLMDSIGALTLSLEETITAHHERYTRAQLQAAVATSSFLDDLSKTFGDLGLSEENEDRLTRRIRTQAQDLSDLYAGVGNTENVLALVKDALKHLQSC